MPFSNLLGSLTPTPYSGDLPGVALKLLQHLIEITRPPPYWWDVAF